MVSDEGQFFPLTLASLKRDVCKQYRHRSDVAERGVGSGSALFVFSSDISTKYDNNKNYPDIPYIGNEHIQTVKVEESIRHESVKSRSVFRTDLVCKKAKRESHNVLFLLEKAGNLPVVIKTTRLAPVSSD